MKHRSYRDQKEGRQRLDRCLTDVEQRSDRDQTGVTQRSHRGHTEVTQKSGFKVVSSSGSEKISWLNIAWVKPKSDRGKAKVIQFQTVVRQRSGRGHTKRV